MSTVNMQVLGGIVLLFLFFRFCIVLAVTIFEVAMKESHAARSVDCTRCVHSTQSVSSLEWRPL